MRGPA